MYKKLPQLVSLHLDSSIFEKEVFILNWYLSFWKSYFLDLVPIFKGFDRKTVPLFNFGDISTKNPPIWVAYPHTNCTLCHLASSGSWGGWLKNYKLQGSLKEIKQLNSSATMLKVLHLVWSHCIVAERSIFGFQRLSCMCNINLNGLGHREMSIFYSFSKLEQLLSNFEGWNCKIFKQLRRMGSNEICWLKN